MSYNPINYMEQGSTRLVIGGAVDVISGGELDIESGGALKIAGTAITATAAELNKMDGVTATASQINYVAGVTAGTVIGSKALVVNATKDISTLRNVTQSGYHAEGVASLNNAVSSTAGTTGFASITAWGTALLSCTGSTASSLCGFRLPTPVAGAKLRIIAGKGIDATHDAIVEPAAKTITFGSTAGKLHRLAFDAADEAVTLTGLSTSMWGITSNVGGVATSTDFTT